jgi:hypothetical protein
MNEHLLARYRLTCAVFIYAYQIWRISVVGLVQFYFLTNWTWFCTGFYFTAVSMEHFGYEIAPQAIHILFSISQVLCWNVCILFWVLLSNVFQFNVNLATKVDWVISHTVILILSLVDVWYSKRRLQWRDSLYPIAIQTFYNIFVLVIRFTYRVTYPYQFLELMETPDGSIKIEFAIALYIVFTLILVGLTGLAMLFVWIRDKCQASVDRSEDRILLTETSIV